MQALRHSSSYFLLVVMALAITPTGVLHDCDHSGHHTDQAAFSAAVCDLCDHLIGPAVEMTRPEQVPIGPATGAPKTPSIAETSFGFERLAADRGPPGIMNS